LKVRALLVFALVALALACKDHEAEAAGVTKQYLAQMRAAIAKHKADTGQYPASLDDLVPNYLRKIHPDPLTNTTDWRVTTEETVLPSTDFQTATTTSEAPRAVIIDVHSNAPGTDRDGVPYANY
jgi:general secretion pathway protein G